MYQTMSLIDAPYPYEKNSVHMIFRLWQFNFSDASQIPTCLFFRHYDYVT